MLGLSFNSAPFFWSPQCDLYISDIESVQKQIVIHLLDSRMGAVSFRLSPYVDRCKILRFQPLVLRRAVFDAMLAHDVFVHNVNDSFISSRIRRTELDRVLRRVRLVLEPYLRHNYLRHQPIARLRSILNQYGEIVSASDNRIKFRIALIERLTNS